MRTRRAAQEQAAAMAQRRFELIAAELAVLRGEAADRPPLPPPLPSATSFRDPDGGAPDPRAPAPSVVDDPIPGGRHARRGLPAGRRAGGWLLDRLPATLQGRVGLGAGQLAVVAILVAAGLAITSWLVVRSDAGTFLSAGETAGGAASAGRGGAAGAAGAAGSGGADGGAPLVDLAAPVGATGAVPGAPGAPGAAGATAGQAAGEVVVDVAGRVRRPGIVTLPAGSRVVDALEAAGGAKRGVGLTSLNLARVLVDGEQLLVGIRPPRGVAAAAAVPVPGASGDPPLLVNVNSADQAMLEELPGIGPVTAAAILQWRTENGGFSAVDELLEVSGIGEATLADIAPYVTV